MTTRDNFSSSQITRALELNAAEVARKHPELGATAHYECEECAFISDQRNKFEVDHIVPCVRGGTATTGDSQTLADIAAGSVVALYKAGVQERVLCVGCNQAKKGKMFVPPGAGYAYRFHEWDRNPRHLYQGAPKVSSEEIARHPEVFDPKRYR